MYKDPFKEYLKQTEPDKRQKAYAWSTAIGLQAVDGLKTSDYLVSLAAKNIEGELTYDEVETLLNSYYEQNPTEEPEDRTEEADKVSWRISKLDNYGKVDIQNKKADIRSEKVDIEALKADIQNKLERDDNNISDKTVSNVLLLLDKCGTDKIFGRSIVEDVTGLKSSRASMLIKFMLTQDIIVPVQGHGKGKYIFRMRKK